MRAEVIDKTKSEMETDKTNTVVVQCIDFRKVTQAQTLLSAEEGLEDGEYFLLATAGAAMNTDSINRLSLSSQAGSNTGLVIDLNHADCGYAKNVVKDDTEEAHQKSMDELGKQLEEQKTNPILKTHLPPYVDEEDNRHTCEAVAIVLGKPQIIKDAKEELAKQNLTGNFDLIA